MNPKDYKPKDYVHPESLLTYVSKLPKDPNKKGKETAPKALYKCSCGVIRAIHIQSAKTGTTKTCGTCQKKGVKPTHGLSKHPLYSCYRSMMERCYDKKRKEYHNYGGRGVIVCEEWKNDRTKFLDWAINNGWQKGLKLDKDIIAKKSGLPNNLYSPERCQFVTAKQNSNCVKNSVYITYRGETKTSKEWEEITGFTSSTLRFRMKHNWDIEEVFNTPLGTRRKGTQNNYKNLPYYQKLIKEGKVPA